MYSFNAPVLLVELNNEDNFAFSNELQNNRSKWGETQNDCAANIAADINLILSFKVVTMLKAEFKRQVVWRPLIHVIYFQWVTF